MARGKKKKKKKKIGVSVWLMALWQLCYHVSPTEVLLPFLPSLEEVKLGSLISVCDALQTAGLQLMMVLSLQTYQISSTCGSGRC